MENENDSNDDNQHPHQMNLEIKFDAVVFDRDRDTETPSLSSHSNSNKLVNYLDEPHNHNNALILSKSSPPNCQPTSPVPVDFLTIPKTELESESESESDSNTETKPDQSDINPVSTSVSSQEPEPENLNQTEELTRIQPINKLQQSQPQFIQKYQLPSFHNCSYCSKTFMTKYILKSHLRTHLNNFYATITPESKSVHKSIHKSKSKVFKKSKKKSKSNSNKDSSSSFTNPVEFRCRATICGQIFYSPFSLEHHELSHMKDKKIVWKCTLCPQTYDCKNKHLLKVHMVRHFHETPFKCDKCSLYLESEKAFANHLLVHDRVEEKVPEEKFEEQKKRKKPPKLFKCDVCSLSFKNNTSLQKHIGSRLPTNLQCYFCPEVFCTKATRTTHMKLNHPVGKTKEVPEPEPVPETEFKAVIMPPVRLSSLMGEDSEIIFAGDPVKCAMCDKMYGNIQALSLHQRGEQLVKLLQINGRQLHTVSEIEPESALNEEFESTNLDWTPEEELSKAVVAQILEENTNPISNVNGEVDVKVEDIKIEPDILLFM